MNLHNFYISQSIKYLQMNIFYFIQNNAVGPYVTTFKHMCSKIFLIIENISYVRNSLGNEFIKGKL